MFNLKFILQPAILLVILMVSTLVFFDRPLIRGDGVAYLAWADTLLIDGDIEMDNQANKLSHVNTSQTLSWDEEQQQWVNIFPFGLAIFQAPFYLLGHLFAEQGWLNINMSYFELHQGVGFPYSLFLMIGANIYAIATALLAWQLGRRLVDSMTAMLVAFTLFVGTPLIYYSTVDVLYSHNTGAFAFAAFLWMFAKIVPINQTDAPDNKQWAWWILMGVIAGLACLTRWQLALAFVPAWIVLVWQRYWRGLLITSLSLLVLLLPLPFVWHEMFGKWFTIPFDETAGQPFFERIVDPTGTWLVFKRLVTHSPVLWISLPGIMGLWRINRQWAGMALAMIGLQLIVNGAAFDWWAGDAYGMRRMSELYVLYVVMACAGLGQFIVVSRTISQTKWISVYAVRLIMVGFLIYSAIYLLAFLNWRWTHPSRTFDSDPLTMILFLQDRPRPQRWQILNEVLATHVGPRAWSQPGP